jgi:hypothetical protein
MQPLPWDSKDKWEILVQVGECSPSKIQSSSKKIAVDENACINPWKFIIWGKEDETSSLPGNWKVVCLRSVLAAVSEIF